MTGICAVWRAANVQQCIVDARAVACAFSLDQERIVEASQSNVAFAASGASPRGQLFQNARVIIACDADILNEAELRDAVAVHVRDTKVATIAEVLAALYERVGIDFVLRLQGAFSVIVWDVRERQLMAAIDGVGIKRLAYFADPSTIAISSRVDALRRCAGVGGEINPRAVANLLNFSSNLGPETIFRSVARLGPGMKLAVNRDGVLRCEKYWNITYTADTRGDERRLSRAMEEVVENAVATRCRGIEPATIGAYLSGGTDSSTVVGLMTRIMGSPIKAFSIGFEDQGFNELGYAQIAARRFGSTHYTHRVGPGECFAAVHDVIRQFDEPYGNSSAIPTYFCARLAADNGVRLLLAGDGGDELFGGNERYATDKVFASYERIPGVVRSWLIEPLAAAALPNFALVRRSRNYIRRAKMDPIERFCSFQFLRTTALAEVFDGDFLHSLNGYSVIDIPSHHYRQAPASSHLDRLLYVDVNITLADNDLPKVTYMSDLAGIETRFPFLDRTVAEFSGTIPARLKVKGLNKRHLFKRTFRNLLPGEIVRKKKHGFGIPVASWMRSDPSMRELARDTLLSSRATSRGYFRRGFVESLFARHEADETSYYGDILWTILALELWHIHSGDEIVQPAVACK